MVFHMVLWFEEGYYSRGPKFVLVAYVVVSLEFLYYDYHLLSTTHGMA